MGGKIPLGFTIVETLIFLAISGVMLTTAFAFISGKQNTTEFNQGIHQIVSNLQLEISQVQTGSYLNNNNDISCSQGQTSNQITIGTGTPAQQGANLGCQYIGQVIQFEPNGNNDQYAIYPVASNQNNATGPSVVPISSVSQIQPCAVYEPVASSPCGSNAQNSDNLITHQLPYNITIKSVTLKPTNGAVSNIGMIAYYTAATTGNITDCDNNQLGSNDGGGLGVDLIPFKSSVALGLSNAQAVADINDITNGTSQGLCGSQTVYSPAVDYNQPVQICLDSGTTQQSAIITLGSGGDPGSVDLSILESACPTS